MNFEISDNNLFIKNIGSSFKPRHKSQLDKWGFVKLSNEDSFYVDNNIETILLKVIKYFDKSEIEYNLSDNCRHLVDNILRKKEDFLDLIKFANDFKNGIVDKDDLNKHIMFLKKNIIRKLKEHQIKASYHLSIVGNGANFSVPGSGKTTVILCNFEKLRLEGVVNTLFVVGPPACFWPWKNEFKKVLGRDANDKILAGCSRNSRRSEYYKLDNIYELYLITFHTLLNDQDEILDFFKNNKIKPLIVIDEAHYIKKIEGNWAKAVLKIARYAEYRCVLTGTPIPKSYTDLYNLIDFLWPENNLIEKDKRALLRINEENKNFNETSNT